jgi:hypothetical protein
MRAIAMAESGSRDLRKLTNSSLQRILVNLGMRSNLVDELNRWERVQRFRELTSEDAPPLDATCEDDDSMSGMMEDLDFLLAKPKAVAPNRDTSGGACASPEKNVLQLYHQGDRYRLKVVRGTPAMVHRFTGSPLLDQVHVHRYTMHVLHMFTLNTRYTMHGPPARQVFV